MVAALLNVPKLPMFWPNTPNMTRCRHFSEEIHLQPHKKGWNVKWPEQRSSYCGTRCFIACVSCSCFLFLSLSLGCSLKSGKPTKWCGSKSLENKAKAAEKVSCFMISGFKHFKHPQNPQNLNMKRTWRHFDRQLAQIFGCGGAAPSDSTTEGHPIGWCQSRGITSGDQHELGSPVEMSLLCKKVGIAKQSLLWNLGIGTPNEQKLDICSFSLVIFHYLANASNKNFQSRCLVVLVSSQVTHLSTWFSRAPALLHWSSKRKPHKTT